MDEKQRLNKWMEENGHDYRSLALATGDTVSNVHMMTKGHRDVSDGFKYRFWLAFGQDETCKVFGKQPVIEHQEAQP